VFNEKKLLLNQFSRSQHSITNDDLSKLPIALKKYLIKAGVIGKYKDGHAIFKQRGRIKTSKEKGWTAFRAIQHMTASSPNFIWSAQAYPLFIQDKSANGKGEVKVNLFGLKNVATFNGPKADESALARCLGELMFYPIGFLSEHISWEVLNAHSLKAKVQMNGTETEGVFYFNEEGLLSSFQALRYKDEALENFTGIAEDYKSMDGLFIPSKMKAIWNLKDGDFEYFNCTITHYQIY
jgi:hypothetical protein